MRTVFLRAPEKPATGKFQKAFYDRKKKRNAKEIPATGLSQLLASDHGLKLAGAGPNRRGRDGTLPIVDAGSISPASLHGLRTAREIIAWHESNLQKGGIS